MNAKDLHKFFIYGCLPGIRMGLYGRLYAQQDIPTSQLLMLPEARLHGVGCDCFQCHIRNLRAKGKMGNETN